MVDWREVSRTFTFSFECGTSIAHHVARLTGVDHSLPINSLDGMEHCRRCFATHPLAYRCRHQQLFFDFPPPIDQKTPHTADSGLESGIRPVMVIPTGHVYLILELRVIQLKAEPTTATLTRTQQTVLSNGRVRLPTCPKNRRQPSGTAGTKPSSLHVNCDFVLDLFLRSVENPERHVYETN